MSQSKGDGSKSRREPGETGAADSASGNRGAKVGLSGRWGRREVLRIGALGAAAIPGLTLAELLHADEQATLQATHKAAQQAALLKTPARADACIIIHLNGGPSHLDMWDMKPDAPAEVRGEFQPISSSLVGISVSEHLPRMAKWMNRCTLVRSMHHSVNNAHAAAVYVSLTGHDRGEIGGGTRPTDNPSPGAVLSHVRPAPPDAVPHVALPYMTKEGAGGPPQPGFFGGWMGRAFDPLWILKDPNAVDFSIPEFTLRLDDSPERLAQRGNLLSRLNSRIDVEDPTSGPRSMNRFQSRALDVLTSNHTQAAFRLDQEPTELRESYGRNIYGQSCLLARRLIEAGTRVVTVSWAPDANATWDTHGGNFKKLKNPLLPQFDAAFSSLVNDLQQRGRLERTLVAVLGDFGRTPKINKNDAGRDHWNYCYSVLLVGGGTRQGYVHGASDKIGAFPADRPVTPGDIIATIYHALGVDYRRQLYDSLGRPHRIVPTGDLVDELLS